MTKSVNRRHLLAFGVGALVAPQSAQAANDLTLVYVSAYDCPECIVWARDYKPKFVASPEYEKLVVREVACPSIRQAFQKVDHWPEDLRWVRDFFWKKNLLWVPAFALVRDGKLLTTGGGLENQYSWSVRVWPAIQRELANS